MKALLTKIICVMMIASLFTVSVGAFAAEPEAPARHTLTEAEAQAMFEEAFPEDFLLTRSAAQPAVWDPDNQTLISYETRALSDTEEVTRLEFSNGARAYVGSVNFYQNSHSSTGSSETFDMDIVASVAGFKEMMYIHGFNYTINYSYNDVINNAGNMNGSTVGIPLPLVTKGVEDSSGPATATYSGLYQDPLIIGANRTIMLQVRIGNNQRTYAIL